MQSQSKDRRTLEAFVLDNPELEKLEALLGEFNLFEAIGAVRPELRHSDFLSFLLNPQENHGLGDAFVKRFLQRALANVEPDTLPLTALEVALLDLDNLEVRREWQNIDILLLDTSNRIAVIIENKIASGEHEGQLRRYWRIASNQIPAGRVVGLFLTPEGFEPSDERYIAIDYNLIYDLLQEMLAHQGSALPDDVRITLHHYTQMLRRHIMPESDIAELCRQIYRKHRRALDLIYEHRPDVQAEMRDLLEQLIADNVELLLEHSSKTSIRFIPRAWDSPILKVGSGWVESGRMLLFDIDNRPDRLAIRLYIGPGPTDIREQLLEMADSTSPLRVQRRTTKWTMIFVRRILNKTDYVDATIDELSAHVSRDWNQFLERDIPRLTEIIRQQTWLWPDTQTDTPTQQP